MRSGKGQSQITLAWEAWQASPHGSKIHTLDQYAKTMDIGDRQLRRLFVGNGLEESPEPSISGSRKLKYTRQESWVSIVASIKTSPPADEGQLVTAMAVTIALRQGLIPEEAKEVSRGTWDRWLRKYSLQQKEKRANRIRSRTPNQAWYVDFSRSNNFNVVRSLGDGDYLLSFDPAKKGPFKNEAQKKERLRVWISSAVDDCSSYTKQKYFIATGENALDALAFLEWCMCKEDDSKLLMYGRPLNVILDNGSTKKSSMAKNAFGNCGIGLPGRTAYNSKAGGRVERPFRTLFARFEMPFWALQKANPEKKLELTLSELNRQCENYLLELNNMPHPTDKSLTRAEMWMKILHSGVVEIPKGALYVGFRQHTRTVAIDGTLKFGGKTWLVIGTENVRGHVFEDMNGVLTFRDPSGISYRVKPFEEIPFGEYKGIKNLPVENLDYPEMINPQSYYNDNQQAANLVSMPPRITEVVVPSKPFAEPGDYPDVAIAIADLIQLIGGAMWSMLAEESKTGLSNKIAGDLSFNNVQNIADQLITAGNRSQQKNIRLR